MTSKKTSPANDKKAKPDDDAAIRREGNTIIINPRKLKPRLLTDDVIKWVDPE